MIMRVASVVRVLLPEVPPRVNVAAVLGPSNARSGTVRGTVASALFAMAVLAGV